MSAATAAGARSRVSRGDAVVENGLRAWAGLVYLFLYLPIAIVVLYAFNDSRTVSQWEGFGLQWWGTTWGDASVRRALTLSLWTAALNAVLAVALGTAAAVGLRNVRQRTRTAFDTFMYMTLIVPEIVVALASLLFLSEWCRRTPVCVPLGPGAIVLTHAVFNTSLVALICRARLAGMDRALEEASADLGATRWGTFLQVTLPQLFPAIVAGGLLSFTLSFDDVVLSTFVTGVGSTTLPLRVFSELRFGLTPTANIVATTMLVITLTVVVVAQMLLRRSGGTPAGVLAAGGG